MDVNRCSIFLMLLLSFMSFNTLEGQNIRGDTIFVDANSVVTVFFPSPPSKAELSVNEEKGSLYKVSIMGKKSLSILALKEGVKDQDLEVTEGDRKHLFVVSYKEGSPARSIDLSSKKTLTARAEETRKKVSQALNDANSLYSQAKNNNLDQPIWEKVETKYLGLEKVVNSKNAAIVKSRLEEYRKQLQVISKENRYRQLLDIGGRYFSSKKYGEAREAYLKALEEKPGDALALKNIKITDSVWAKGYVDKGDEAFKSKKYIIAKSNYQEALRINPDYPFLRDKFNQVKKYADPEIYKAERKKGDLAIKADDIEEARIAYDSALSVKPGDAFINDQLKKLVVKEKEIEQEKKTEADYQNILATAKSLAEKASKVHEYDDAIKQYKLALDKFPTRKFPAKKINELTKIKNSLTAN